MPEVKRLCDVYKVRMFCDKCFKEENLVTGKGEMIFLHSTSYSHAMESSKPLSICTHECNSCRDWRNFDKKYPYMEYREVERKGFIYPDPNQRSPDDNN